MTKTALVPYRAQVIIPHTEPEQLRAGDTWQWVRKLAEYPATAWVLHYYLRAVTVTAGTLILDIAGTPDGVDHTISVAASATAVLAAGEWSWQAAVRDTATGNIRKTLDTGTLVILRDLETETGNVDTRSFAKRMYDAICALLENRATRMEKMYVITGRTLEHLDPDKLETWKNYYASVVHKEMVDSGQKSQKSANVNVRFGPVVPEMRRPFYPLDLE